MKIGVIGAGAMGSAIIQGLLEGHKELELVVCETDVRRHQEIQVLGVEVFASTSAVHGCDAVIVAVKPKHVQGVLQELQAVPAGVVVSIAAGVTLAQLASWSRKTVVRVMPNTPCLMGKGMTAIAFGDGVPSEMRAFVESVFTSLGEVLILPEASFDAVTALSGCGPAYVYLIIEAMIDAGCALGLSREAARTLVTTTVMGSSAMVQTLPDHPAALKDQVTSPGGATIHALQVFEQRGLRGILWDGIEQAAWRSAQMSKDDN